jgi:hypothetical protein
MIIILDECGMANGRFVLTRRRILEGKLGSAESKKTGKTPVFLN